MNQERYHQIEALAEAALKLQRSRRDDFLQRACGSDQDLLQRVTALMEGYEASDDFLERPALESWARDAAQGSESRSLAGRDLGRFLVLRKLGAGGIGEVWLAKDKELSREVALKFLSPELAGGSDQARRFRQEARAASALNHPNLITIFDIGEFDGRQFIAQEYVPGKTLREMLVLGPIVAETVVDIATQIAVGLRAAHTAGVVHRDIKPENIMVRPDGVVKVLDFGIARFMEEGAAIHHKSGSELTRPGFILGTARYMSPEQARGLPVDGRSDIFSLGVVLYEMFTGSAPFTGATPSDILAAILKYEPPPLSRNARHVPAEFERIVLRCLAKDPDARYGSAAPLHEELKSVTAKLRRTSSPIAPWVFGATAVLAVVAIAAGILLKTYRAPVPLFNAMKITRLATRGEVTDIAIARDGKLLGYVVGEGTGDSIWVRDLSGSQEREVVTEENAELSGIIFSPDDSMLYYRRRRMGEVGELHRVLVEAGSSRRVIGDVSSAPALSPDGQHVAFIRLKPSSWEASLVVTNADGSGESTLETVRRPQFFDEHGVAWSPDGQAVACFAGGVTPDSDGALHLVEVNIRHPSLRRISPHEWISPRSVAWAAKRDLLIVTAAAANDIEQLWVVQHDNGEVTPITHDLTSYGPAGITDDGRSLVSVQRQTSIAIWAGAANDANHFTRVSRTPLSSSHIGVAWTPDGRIVYNDAAEGYRNLWIVDAHGTNPQRLTSGSGNKDDFVVGQDGRYIVYARDGHIWRVSADGTQPRELTKGQHDVHPDMSPDGNTVVYASFTDWAPGVGGEPTLWRVPVSGGVSSQISGQPASFPRFSPDSKHLACIHFPGKDPRSSSTLLAVLKSDGTGGFTVFQTSPSVETPLGWTQDSEAIDYILNANGVGNLWRQPLNGGQPYQITHFDRDLLFDFSWSPDGRLACARGTTTGSPILIESFEEARIRPSLPALNDRGSVRAIVSRLIPRSKSNRSDRLSGTPVINAILERGSSSPKLHTPINSSH